MPSLSVPLTLPEDVLLIPVRDLPEESRGQLDCGPEDVAVSRLQGRSGSKIVDPDAADLLGRFRTPRTLIEAVILFGRERELDPDAVLEGAYPFLRGMVESGFLVPAEAAAAAATEGSRTAPRFPAGAAVLGGTVERTLQVLEDTEVAVLVRPDGRRSVLKVERPLAGAPGRMTERFRHEARFLAHLGGYQEGCRTPELLRQGEVDGRAYLEIGFCPGVDAAAAAAEPREQEGAAGRRNLLALLQRIAKAYVDLHRAGVVHGDVHPRNVLVDGDGAVWLLDFGAARALDAASGLPTAADRGGVPFFFEPEFAAAQLAGIAPPPATPAGEQYALAALLYLLAAGVPHRDFSLGREEMLREIATAPPLAFTERGRPAWLQLEAVLGRALAKRPEERYPTLADFAAALDRVSADGLPASAPETAPSKLDRLLENSLAAAGPGGVWFEEGLTPAPTASVTYGAAGTALALLQIAHRRSDPRLLALADLWARRAARQIPEGPLEDQAGFYNDGIDITRQIVGEGSPYHTPSGVHAVAALIARAQGDPHAQMQATAAFLEAATRPVAGLDLALGKASTLLGAALLLDAAPASPHFDPAPLRAFGDAALAELRQALADKPHARIADVEYLGIAHGWAGYLYAALLWCDVSGARFPTGLARRLGELADLAMAVGRGLQWPWVLGRPGEAPTMPGWCNGSCGHVFLWTLAHRMLGDPRYLDLARGAAWDSWDSPEQVMTLCCGLAGRAWALLNLYRHTGETVWLDRARALARRAAQSGTMPPEYPHSLYKGELGLAVLAADLERPEESAMPFFEPFGYGGGGTLGG